MRTKASLLLAASVALVSHGSLAEDSMKQKDGMAGDPMSKKPAMESKAKTKPMKKPAGGDAMSKGSMSKEPMKRDSPGGKPTSM